MIETAPSFWLPLDSRHKVLVFFYPTFGELRYVATREDERLKGQKFYACFQEFDLVVTPRGSIKTQHVANLYFCQKHNGAGVVAHELQHLILMWSSVKGWKGYDSSGEEKIAIFAESITRNFWIRFYRLFPHKEKLAAKNV